MASKCQVGEASRYGRQPWQTTMAGSCGKASCETIRARSYYQQVFLVSIAGNLAITCSRQTNKMVVVQVSQDPRKQLGQQTQKRRSPNKWTRIKNKAFQQWRFIILEPQTNRGFKKKRLGTIRCQTSRCSQRSMLGKQYPRRQECIQTQVTHTRRNVETYKSSNQHRYSD